MDQNAKHICETILIIFSLTLPPEYLKIPGEAGTTRVSEYLERPMKCRNCQEYGHTHKFCQRKNNHRCSKCARDGHEIINCTQNEARCYHCDGQHTSFNIRCQEYIFQVEVKNIQQKKRVSRREAVMIVKDRYPHMKTPHMKRESECNKWRTKRVYSTKTYL